jgi:lipoteichoic acid synthase
MIDCSVQSSGVWTGCRVALADLALFILPAALKAHFLAGAMGLSTLQADLANVLLLLNLACLAAALPVRLRRAVLGLCALATSFLLFVDWVHYRAFGEVVTLRELGHAVQLKEVYTGVLPYLRLSDLWLAADVPIWLFLLRTKESVSALLRVRAVVWLCAFYFSAAALGSMLFVYGLMIGSQEASLTTNRGFAIQERGAFNYHLLDAIGGLFAKSTRRPASAQQLARVRHWLETHRPPGRDLLGFGTAKGRNVIFLQVESLEAFVIGLRIEGQEITPCLNRLTKESFYFSRFFPQTGSGSTSDAEFCALNSLLPSREGVVVREYAENDFCSLPAILRSHGYHSVAMSVCRPNLWNMGRMHRAYGLERRYYYETFANGLEKPLTILDDRFLTRARELLRQQSRPFFAHLATLSSHTPFTWIRPQHKTLRLGNLEGTTLADYLHSAHFVDSVIGQFLNDIMADGLGKDSVVFIYGDHSALPMEERDRIRRYETDATGLALDQFLRRRVPLFVIIPGLNPHPANLGESMAGQIDLAPSVLHLLGISDREAVFLGQNLFREREPLVYFRNGSFATDHELFHSPDGTIERGTGRALAPGAQTDARVRQRAFQEVRECLWVSDTVLDLNLVPILLQSNRSSVSTAESIEKPLSGK